MIACKNRNISAVGTSFIAESVDLTHAFETSYTTVSDNISEKYESSTPSDPSPEGIYDSKRLEVFVEYIDISMKVTYSENICGSDDVFRRGQGFYTSFRRCSI